MSEYENLLMMKGLIESHRKQSKMMKFILHIFIGNLESLIFSNDVDYC